ncbi:MAG: hypothetical protein SNJ77_08070 [Cytophagales bacterium]
MTFFNFLLLLTLQFFSGFGIISRLDRSLSRFVIIPTSVLVGSFLGTLCVYILGALYLPITWLNLILVFSLLAVLFFLPFKKNIESLRNLFKFELSSVKIYELLIAFFVFQVFFISAWRTYYQPVISFDSVCGIDLFAKNAILEGKLVCWIFNGEYIKDLSTQAYYAPFTAFQQIIYRFAGFEVGQIWLSKVFLCFIMFMYHSMKEYVHGAIAGIILYITITVPEFFAYTFILQTDFSNAVFTMIAVVFLAQFMKTENYGKLYLSILFFALAIWTRSETVFSFLSLQSLFW